jgi:hypothetical protein
MLPSHYHKPQFSTQRGSSHYETDFVGQLRHSWCDVTFKPREFRSDPHVLHWTETVTKPVCTKIARRLMYSGPYLVVGEVGSVTYRPTIKDLVVAWTVCCHVFSNLLDADTVDTDGWVGRRRFALRSSRRSSAADPRRRVDEFPYRVEDEFSTRRILRARFPWTSLLMTTSLRTNFPPNRSK